VAGQLKVSARSSPNAVAGAFAGVVREHGTAEVHVIGAGALNQAMKAVAIARTFLLEQDIDLICFPSFVTLQIDGQERTAIRLVVEDRQFAAGAAAADALDGLRIEHDPPLETRTHAP
jgi:stage V sporulation protein S